VTWYVVRHPRTPGGTLTVDVTLHGIQKRRSTLRAPSYQAPNVATAMAVIAAALWEVAEADVADKIMKTLRFPGRFELLRDDPPLVIDGAHNPEAAEMLAGAIGEAFGDELPMIVLAILSDKDAEGIVRALAPVGAGFVVTENASPRCMSAADLAVIVERVTGVAPAVEPVLEKALPRAAAPGRGVVVTGSLYTAGATRALFVR
jgi:dihydrofolate synthase/folylpolyglutamate synthase